ncbi:hypothetical protein [Pseudooctadecabacter jejudonensis]|uniref:Uncharacterized protein n=1 Tax=Pseudooctadecabacter jejudonensis TaxID=1391910 RepID=A0A1Y5T600_9RHOB|nr:hypothetical protein [Pseudooctadecabacter jejudonensis]SLN56233.1 hypothetical protein PSJ8397_02979 [Pseudooctadecabacter jejudonensis]
MIRNLFKVLFFPLFGRIKSKPVAPPPLASNRVHVFCGEFASEAAATDYALGLTDPNLATDLGGVGIGPDDAEIIFGQDRIMAARPMFHFTAPQPAAMGNTYILLSDRGYRTSALTGDRVIHLGLCDIS